MSEKPKQKFDWVAVSGLVVAILGLWVPIAWEKFKGETAVEMRHTGQTVLMRQKDKVDKLEAKYDGKVIKELETIRFVLLNAGRTPIKEEDIKEPVTLRFPNGSVLEAKAESTFPKNLPISIVPSADRSSVQVKFALLNPGENAQISILVADVSDLKYTADARIVNGQLKLTEKIDRSAEPRWHPSPITNVGICFGGLLVMFFLYWELTVARRLRSLIDDFLKGKLLFAPETTKEQAAKMIEQMPSFYSVIQNRDLLNAISGVPEGSSIRDKSKELQQLSLEYIVKAQAAVLNMRTLMFIELVVLLFATYQMWKA